MVSAPSTITTGKVWTSPWAQLIVFISFLLTKRSNHHGTKRLDCKDVVVYFAEDYRSDLFWSYEEQHFVLLGDAFPANEAHLTQKSVGTEWWMHCPCITLLWSESLWHRSVAQSIYTLCERNTNSSEVLQRYERTDDSSIFGWRQGFNASYRQQSLMVLCGVGTARVCREKRGFLISSHKKQTML